jgi:23S rRNA (adenine2503-C2)-methyltransferase
VRPQLKDHSIESLRERLSRDGLAPYRADQIAGWLYQRGIEDPGLMTDLSLDARDWLARTWEVRALEVDAVQTSVDGTVKAALRCRDGSRIESVLIPEEDRTTLCLSTQVGCPLACQFCATGAFGFQRNLSTAEIVDQVCRMRSLLPGERRITNIVFMGMGEPLLNLEAVIEAVRILVHPKAFGLAPRRVTVSTVGVVPRIRPLLESLPVHLAVSLHAGTDAVRDRLVPLNRRFPLKVLLDELRGIEQITPRHPVFFEYTLIEGVNDSLDEARSVVALLKGLPAKLNLIPMNAHADSALRAPPPTVIDRFAAELAGAGLRVTLRRSRGEDIDAACGQLALRPGPTA